MEILFCHGNSFWTTGMSNPLKRTCAKISPKWKCKCVEKSPFSLNCHMALKDGRKFSVWDVNFLIKLSLEVCFPNQVRITLPFTFQSLFYALASNTDFHFSELANSNGKMLYRQFTLLNGLSIKLKLKFVTQCFVGESRFLTNMVSWKLFKHQIEMGWLNVSNPSGV